jgi:hypothetical protein
MSSVAPCGRISIFTAFLRSNDLQQALYVPDRSDSTIQHDLWRSLLLMTLSITLPYPNVAAPIYPLRSNLWIEYYGPRMD